MSFTCRQIKGFGTPHQSHFAGEHTSKKMIPGPIDLARRKVEQRQGDRVQVAALMPEGKTSAVKSTGTKSAPEATVLDVLDYLDDDFQSFAQGVANGSYTLWLGSGISLTRVDGLNSILRQTLDALQSRIDPADPSCRFRQALERILVISGVDQKHLDQFDLGVAPSTWPPDPLSDLVGALVQKYSLALDVRVPGERPDYLLWDIVDVRSAYGSVSNEPDCEHVAIALLILEGCAQTVVSANWDGLIEKAICQLGRGSDDSLRVCVIADDLVDSQSVSQLIKFHGCAVRAKDNEDTYRPLLIHQMSQIVNYQKNEAYRAIRNELVNQATKRHTLMIGLSAQDVDIQAIFVDAADARSWPYPSTPLPYVFGADVLGGDQGTILRTVYGQAFEEHGNEIEARSVLRAYGKALLTGLVLHVLTQKAETLAGRCRSKHLKEHDLNELVAGLRCLRDLAAQNADSDFLERIWTIADSVSNTMRLFREGRPSSKREYWPVTSSPLPVLARDKEVPNGGLPELAVALSLVGLGIAEGWWSMPEAPSQGFLSLRSQRSTGHLRLVFAATPRALVELETSGFPDPTVEDVVVVSSCSAVVPGNRAPRRAPGRVLPSGTLVVDFEDLLNEADSASYLRTRFREVLGL